MVQGLFSNQNVLLFVKYFFQSRQVFISVNNHHGRKVVLVLKSLLNQPILVASVQLLLVRYEKKCVLIYHLFLLNCIIFDIIRCSQWLPASIATALGPPPSDIAWPFWRARPLDPFGGRPSSRQLGHSLRLLAIDHPRQGVRWQPSSPICDSTQRNKTCCCRSISRWFWHAGNLAERILSEKIDATS